MKTALNASMLAIAAFIIPYIFGFNEAMLFIDTGVWEVILIIVTSFVGLLGVAAGLKGWMLHAMPVWQRVVAIAGGLLLIYPGVWTDVGGLVIVAGIFAIQYFTKKKITAAAA
jgi:TRAP-type uncharacterized transport system fused permease subunit